mgnify:CR=1 FL=1
MTTAVIQDGMQTASTLDALWILIQSQSKSVQRALSKKLNEKFEQERRAKVKMSEQEFYAKLDKSLASTAAGPIYTMEEDESGEDFINRLLSNSK